MEIGILSDTHNNHKNLQAALDMFQQRGIHTLIHCGDVTSAEIIQKMAGFQVILAFGNGDVASGEIRSALMSLNPQENYAGLLYTGRIGDARIAVTHGHMGGKVEELLHSGEFDYVFKGHSHRHKDERVGPARLINPGALGGLHAEERRVCVLNLDTGKAEFILINPVG